MIDELMMAETKSFNLEGLITNKWKVAYDDMSLDSRPHPIVDGAGDGSKKSTSSHQPTTSIAWRKTFDLRLPSKVILKYNNSNNNNDSGVCIDSKTSVQNQNVAGQQQSRNEIAPKKSQSAPPSTTRSFDCTDCPVPVDASVVCACPRKRKEPQDMLHEHERKFSRSSSLELDKMDDSATTLGSYHSRRCLLPPLCSVDIYNKDSGASGGLMMKLGNGGSQEDEKAHHVLKEVQEHVQIRKNTESARNDEPPRLVKEAKKKSKRRKRPRREDQAQATNTVDTKENNDIDRKQQETDNEPAMETDEAKSTENAEVPVPARKNALSFLFAAGPALPSAIGRRSSSPLPAGSRSALAGGTSPVPPRRCSAGVPAPTPDPDRNQVEDSWVAQRLAHIMRADTETTAPRETTPQGESVTDSIPAALTAAQQQQQPVCSTPISGVGSINIVDSNSNSSRFVDAQQRLFGGDGGRNDGGGPSGEGRGNGRSGGDKFRSRHKQLTKKMSALRRKIEQVELQLKEENGYRQSHQDKLNNSQLKSLLTEQDRLKKEIKAEREEQQAMSSSSSSSSHHRMTSSLPQHTGVICNNIELIRERLNSILVKMEDNRLAAGRPSQYQDLQPDQVLQEKLELQSLLRDYEKEFGHPEGKEEKECMKAVYERYRIIKRMARRSSQNRSGDSCVDLMTIPEDEEVDLTLVSPQHRIHLQLPSKHNNTSSDAISRHDMDLPSFNNNNNVTPDANNAIDDAVMQEHYDADSPPTKLWHAMTPTELLAALRRVREDKKVARRAVKEFEEQFKNTTGRRVTKEDREPLERTYKVYKTRKSQVKLINALLSKHDGKHHHHGHHHHHHRSERIER